jgi:hypothetical protein
MKNKKNDDQKYWPLRCTPEEHKNLKRYALENNISMTKAIKIALDLLYKSRAKK